MPEPSATQNQVQAQPEKAAEEGGEEIPATKTIPDGIVPLFFSGASQQVFGCVADTDLTSEHPYVLIPKEKVVEDFKNRAAVSDFHPVKKKLLDYPGDEILLVYDYDFKYGENFYVCITEAAKELILNPPPEELEGAGKDGGEAEEEEIPKTPEPKEWIGQGSELEIAEEALHTARPLFKFTFSRKRRHFGSPCSFSDRNDTDHAEGFVEIASTEDPNSELQRMEMEVAVQAVTEKADAASQTEWLKPVNAAVQYVPRDMSESDAQSTWEGADLQAFLSNICPRIELSLQQNEIMDVFLDDYRNLSDTDYITGNKSDTNLKEYQSFTDLKFSKNKLITWIDWHPTSRGIVAVSCGESYDFDERVDLSSRLLLSRSLILIWSFADPIHPQLFLEAPDDIVCFKFNPTNPKVIAGGCLNGQVVLWDISEYHDRLQINKAPDTSETRAMASNLAIFNTEPKLDHAPIVSYCAVSSIEHGHSMTICDLHWIPNHIEVCTKTANVLENTPQACNQLLTCSIDGNVMFWDTRPPPQKRANQTNKTKTPINMDQPFYYLDLTWKPFLKIPLPRSENPGNFSATRVSIREKQRVITQAVKEEEGQELGKKEDTEEGGEGKPIEGASTKYYVGTEDGEVVYGDWLPSRDSESGKLVASRPDFHFNAHCGRVCCLERSPFFRDVILSVGGWTFSIWKEGAQSDALLRSCSSTVPLTGGAWSPTRPGVFFITKLNGNVDVWDLMDRSHEPSLAQNVSSMSITAAHPWSLTSKQLMLAVGDSGGTLHILEIPWSLSHPSTNEVSIMQAFFDREVARLEFVTERAALRAEEKKAMDAANMEQEKEGRDPKLAESWDDRAKKDYDEYLAMEDKLLTELGLRDPPQELEQ